MIKLILMTAKKNISSYFYRPGELLLSTMGSLINNCLYIYGIYILASLTNLSTQLKSGDVFLITTGLITTAWGLINILAGGLVGIGRQIENGEFESFMATPKHPLLLAAISKADISYLADLSQGITVIIYLGFKWSSALALKMAIVSLVTAIALLGIVIIGGSLSFFPKRGNALSALFIQTIVSMSLFPMGSALKGKERFILYLSPILFTSFLPLQVMQRFSVISLCMSVTGSLLIFFGSVAIFNLGIKNYRSANFIRLAK